MILGVLLARKKYPLMKYICVLFIVVGVALFFYKDVSQIKFKLHSPEIFRVSQRIKIFSIHPKGLLSKLKV